VIQVFEEERIPISAIIGSSMGAYVGALWAAGVEGRELARLAAEIKDRRTLLRLIDPACPMSGILKGEKIRKHLERTLGEMKISDLNIPMSIVATELDHVCGEVLPETTQVAAAVQASCAIPGICAPVHLNERRYIDGGAAQPLPVRLLKVYHKVDAVIAVNVLPTLSDLASCEMRTYPMPPLPPTSNWEAIRRSLSRQFNLFAYGNVLDTFKRCLTSAQMRIIAEEADSADVLIHPYLCNSRWYDYENSNRYIEAGRLAAQAALPAIRKLLEPRMKPRNKPHHYETLPVLTPVGCGGT
jgi:NTE family protein